MKRFVFRLESVLRVRRFELDRTVGDLARLEAERRRREDLVRGEVTRLAQGQAYLAAEAEQGADGERLQLRSDAVTSGRYRLARVERSVEDLSAPISEARRRVEHARARVRSLERLKENAAEAHHREGIAAEQAELEELAISRIAVERATAQRARAASEGRSR